MASYAGLNAKCPKLCMLLSKAESSRFATPLSDDAMTQISKGKRSVNTDRSTAWAVAAFKQWIEQRNKTGPEETCREDFLEMNHAGDIPYLERWLCRFVVEARKQDGQPYPPSSLQNLLSGILRCMREQHSDTPDFLSKKDWRFRALRGTIESTFAELRKNGVGAEVKHTPIIEKKEEEQLWSVGVMGVDTPRLLLHAVFFYVGKIFCLRGGVEQRSLRYHSSSEGVIQITMFMLRTAQRTIQALI